MTAYLSKMPGNKWTLTLVARPCNGAELAAGEHIAVTGKREANAVCKARGARPHNW